MNIKSKILLGCFIAALLAILLVLGICLDDWGFIIFDGVLFAMALTGFMVAAISTNSGGF